MSIALLELGASALGDLVRPVVLAGGATVGLWMTDPAAPEPRPTEDVDVIVEVTSRGRFADFEQRLRERRFREDLTSELSRHRVHPRFVDGVYAGLPPDDASQARAEEIVLPRPAAITSVS